MNRERIEKLAGEGDPEASTELTLLRLREEEVTVSYDGRYPTACLGTLTIHVGGQPIYSKKYVCESTGGVYYVDGESYETEEGVGYSDGDCYAVGGDLHWDPEEAAQFPPWIRLKVQETLDKVEVCCGGCI